MSMNTPLSQAKRAWARAEYAASRRSRHLWGRHSGVRLSDFAGGTSLGGRCRELAGRSVLLVANDQLAAALALIELDGVASRIILGPVDPSADQLHSIMRAGCVDAIVSTGQQSSPGGSGAALHVLCDVSIRPADEPCDGDLTTEWVLLSSGTSSGTPKLVIHTLATLIAPLRHGNDLDDGVVWGTFYDIRRYGGLQIFLRALMGGGSMVFSDHGEIISDCVARLQQRGVTHISGTPSHWRRLMMSGAANALAPRYVRLSGEIADQPILDTLQSTYRSSRIVHAFASTEAGVVFEVTDGLAGFPADFVGVRENVEVRIDNSSLCVRSGSTALRYLGEGQAPLVRADGFVDTGDMVERCGERYRFLGRRNGVMNIGGMKVHPEEIEAVINSHPWVAMSSVQARKNPIIGAVVAAEVVLRSEQPIVPGSNIEEEILSLCRQILPPHKVPATLRVVPSLRIAEAGKLSRSDA